MTQLPCFNATAVNDPIYWLKTAILYQKKPVQFLYRLFIVLQSETG